MHFVYVLQSLKDDQWYVGRTADLKKRLESYISKQRGENGISKKG